jgi:hypothetical protein
MTSLGDAITIVAPYYNLAMVCVVLFLFAKLFSTKVKNKAVFLRPWYFVFAATAVFIVEEVITILRAAHVIAITFYINGFFELLIISLFMYTLLTLKEHIEKKT